MPRQQSEAAAFLDIYKLVIEQKRLRQELSDMDQRRQQITSRLARIERQVASLEAQAEHLRGQQLPSSKSQQVTQNPQANQLNRSQAAQLPTNGSFETLTLDY